MEEGASMQSEIFSWFMPDGCEVLVDAEDTDRVSQFTWNCRHRIRPRKRTGIYVYCMNAKAPELHRFIMHAEPGQIVDHQNWNGLDNRKANLRIVTNSQNMQNRPGANANSKSGVRGVSRFHIQGRDYWGIRVWLSKDHPSGKKSVCKYFPYTDEGLAEAARMAPILRSELMTHST